MQGANSPSTPQTPAVPTNPPPYAAAAYSSPPPSSPYYSSLAPTPTTHRSRPATRRRHQLPGRPPQRPHPLPPGHPFLIRRPNRIRPPRHLATLGIPPRPCPRQQLAQRFQFHGRHQRHHRRIRCRILWVISPYTACRTYPSLHYNYGHSRHARRHPRLRLVQLP